MNFNLKFGYFRVRTLTGVGYVCVALSRPKKEFSATTPHRAAFALCSPKDIFSKKLARQIAAARLQNWKDHDSTEHLNPRVEFITTEGSVTKAMGQALRTLVALPGNNRLVPNWLRSGLKRYKVTFGLTQGNENAPSKILLPLTTMHEKQVLEQLRVHLTQVTQLRTEISKTLDTFGKLK